MKFPCFISHFFLFSLLELFSPIVLLLDLKNHHFVIFVICNPLIRKKLHVLSWGLLFAFCKCDNENDGEYSPRLPFLVFLNAHISNLFHSITFSIESWSTSFSSRTVWPARLPLSRLGRELRSLPSPVPAIESQLLCLEKFPSKMFFIFGFKTSTWDGG